MAVPDLDELLNSSSYLDSRDLESRRQELQDRANDEDNIDPLNEDEVEELTELNDICEDCQEMFFGDWRFGVQLIPEDQFTEYARQLADDIGAVNADADWPNSHIDWEAAADDLKQDYIDIEIRGVTYWGR